MGGAAAHPPVVLIVLDGMGDRPWPELDGCTPLEAAHTPTLDALAASGATGVLHPLGPGRAPGTELSHFVLFGYPAEEYPGRVVFEAAGCGHVLSPDDVALRALFSRVRREADGSLTLTEHFADIDDAACRDLAALMPPVEHAGLTVRLECTGDRQGVVTVSGGASTEITDCDPFFTGRPIAAIRPLAAAQDPDAATRTAAALTVFLGQAYRAFRAAEPAGGGESIFPLLKWTGRRRDLPTFTQRTGMRGATVAWGTLFRGIAAEIGLEYRPVATMSDPRSDIEAKLAEATRAFAAGTEFVHVHTKAPDEAGHAKDPSRKRDVFAALDRGLAGLLEPGALPEGAILCITGDHGTPAGTGLIHSGDPVPLLIAAPGVRADHVTTFSELACAAGSLGHLRGEDLMPLLLNARGTTRYLGARLGTHTGLHWPEDYASFRVGD